ncbi:MAG: M23 family metallopeptidase [bacterium]|nr:M23 family metallopeptidase [bacterium]
MKRQLQGILIFILLTVPSLYLCGGEPEVRFNPGECVYLYTSNADRGYYNAMLHQVALFNRTGESITVDRATIDVMAENTPIQTVFVSNRELRKNTETLKTYQTQGLLRLYEPYLRILQFLGDSITLSPGLTLKPGTAIMFLQKFLVFKGMPGQLKVTFSGKTADGKPVKVSGRIKTVKYQQSNEFIFPVKGAWWVGAGADVSAHHRWVAMEEFALDLVKLDAQGSSYKNTGTRLEDYYCFGQEVVASADGEVVAVETGRRDELDMLRKENETLDQFNQRVQAGQFKFLKENPRHAVGNYVVIKHKGNEYSFYAHLQKGSVTVTKGQPVKQGQVVGKVGHSGNSTEPHLHFHVCNGPDPVKARSIPVYFYRVRLFEKEGKAYLHTGDIVSAE